MSIFQTYSESKEIVDHESASQQNNSRDEQGQTTPVLSENDCCRISVEESADDINHLLDDLRLSVLADRLKCKGVTEKMQLGSLSDEDLTELKSSLKLLEKKRFEESFCPLVRESRQSEEKQSSSDRESEEETRIQEFNIVASLNIDEPLFAISQIQLFTIDDVKLLYEGIIEDLDNLNKLVPVIGDNKYVYDKLLKSKDHYRNICFQLKDRMIYLRNQKKEINTTHSTDKVQHGIPYLRCKKIRRKRPPLRTSKRRITFATIESLYHPTKSPHDVSFQEQVRLQREQG